MFLDVLIKKEVIMKNSKYLVRPDDMHIFDMDESNGCYRSYSTREVTRMDGSRPNAQSHFTYENLTQNYNFFPIDEEKLALFEQFHSIYMDYINWASRSDGHGGSKGGTVIEFLQMEHGIVI